MTMPPLVGIAVTSVLLAVQVPDLSRFGIDLKGEQHLTAIFGIFKPMPAGLRIEDFPTRNLLVEGDRAMLTRWLRSGQVVVRGHDASNAFGIESPRARIIVLFTRPLQRAVKLPLPDATDVLYVQEAEGFRRSPADARVLTRSIEIMPDGTDVRYARFMIERSYALQGGSILIEP